MLTSSSPNSKLFEGSLSLKSSASDAASLFGTCKLESISCPPTKFPEIQFLGTLDGNMTNPLGLTLKPPPESSVDKTNRNGNPRTRGGELAKGGSRLDRIQAQFRQQLQSEKETKLREIFDKSVHEADRRIERITGGVATTSSRNVRSATLMETDPRSDSSGGMMTEFFEERRDMEKYGSNNLTALPNIQTTLKSKRRQSQQQQPQQQQQPTRIASESALKPPRYQPKRNLAAPTLKPKLLSPIAPASEYQFEKSNNGEDSGGEGFNSTYSLSSSTLHPGDFPHSAGNVSSREGGESSRIPTDSKVHLPPVKTKKDRSPRRDPASLSPREINGAAEKTPYKMASTRKAALAKRQQKAAAAAASAKDAAMEADNMKFLDKIIEAVGFVLFVCACVSVCPFACEVVCMPLRVLSLPLFFL